MESSLDTTLRSPAMRFAASSFAASSLPGRMSCLDASSRAAFLCSIAPFFLPVRNHLTAGIAKKLTAYAESAGSKPTTTATNSGFRIAIVGSPQRNPSATTPTKLKTPSAHAIVRCDDVAREKAICSSSAAPVLYPRISADESTASIRPNPPAVLSMVSNLYTISFDCGSTIGVPPNRTSAGRTKLSSSVPTDSSSRSRNGASCSAVSVPLFFWIARPTRAHRRRSNSAFGSPSPNTNEKTASKKFISRAPSSCALYARRS
mmetsp:Transcript_11750/g.39079  ORF Transcript_11750/g.39079 Transcript_11750/m.39079 type:complete len:261 (+) Transcript_11750:436-1218(+)